LAKIFSLSKTYIPSWLNFYPSVKAISFFGSTFIFWQNLHIFLDNFFFSCQNLYNFLVKLFFLGKTYIPSWLNLFLLVKPKFILGKTYIFWENLKPISILS